MTDQFATEAGLLHVVTEDFLLARIAEAQDYFEWELAAAATSAHIYGLFDGFDRGFDRGFEDSRDYFEWEAAAQATEAYLLGYADGWDIGVEDGLESAFSSIDEESA